MEPIVKVAGLVMSGLLSLGFALIGEMELCYSFGGIFSLIIGGPPVGHGIKSGVLKLLR